MPFTRILILMLLANSFFACKTSRLTDEKTKIVLDNQLLPKEINQYGQFVGEWDCEVSNLQKDGTWLASKALWRFEYILGGTAIQDFWTNPSDNKDSKTTLLGTNIRTFNPKENKWQCIWLENKSKAINGIWKSHQDANNNILLYDDTENWLITFYNITENSFDWKWDFKQEDGTMKTMSKMKAVRK